MVAVVEAVGVAGVGLGTVVVAVGFAAVVGVAGVGLGTVVVAVGLVVAASLAWVVEVVTGAAA